MNKNFAIEFNQENLMTNPLWMSVMSLVAIGLNH
jgi:hypothetical protein